MADKKAPDTYSEYVMILVVAPQQRLGERATMSRYPDIAAAV
jgi:hypothetical protein